MATCSQHGGRPLKASFYTEVRKSGLPVEALEDAAVKNWESSLRN